MLIVAGCFSRFPWAEPTILEASLRLVVGLVVMALLSPLIRFVLRVSLQGFLERTLCASRTTFWITSQGMAFRSRLYDQKVLIQRRSGTAVINVRPILQADRNAMAYSAGLDWKRKLPKEHLQESQVLCLVVTTGDPRRPGEQRLAAHGHRLIPVTEINGRVAANYTTVLAAAVALTAATEFEASNQPVSGGVDIDGP